MVNKSSMCIRLPLMLNVCVSQFNGYNIIQRKHIKIKLTSRTKNTQQQNAIVRIWLRLWLGTIFWRQQRVLHLHFVFFHLSSISTNQVISVNAYSLIVMIVALVHYQVPYISLQNDRTVQINNLLYYVLIFGIIKAFIRGSV